MGREGRGREGTVGPWGRTGEGTAGTLGEAQEFLLS